MTALARHRLALLVAGQLLGCGGAPGEVAPPTDGGDHLPPAAHVMFLDVSPEQARLDRPVVPRGALSPVPREAAVLFLNLDGAVVTKVKGPSDAAKNESSVCGGTFPKFDHSVFGADRTQVVGSLVGKLRALVADFDMKVVTARPKAGAYEMVVVGGLPSICGYGDGIGGLAPLDCQNSVKREVSFVFAGAITHLDLLAIAVAHEAAHTFGLPHSSEACDVMSPLYCAAKEFLDKQTAVWPDHLGMCGLTTTNSWRTMLDVLGPAKE